MFPRYRHTPIFDTNRKRCSICSQPVYSLAGIHPQCAIKLPEPQQYRDGDLATSGDDAPAHRNVLEPEDAKAGPDKSLPAPAVPAVSCTCRQGLELATGPTNRPVSDEAIGESERRFAS